MARSPAPLALLATVMAVLAGEPGWEGAASGCRRSRPRVRSAGTWPAAAAVATQWRSPRRRLLTLWCTPPHPESTGAHGASAAPAPLDFSPLLCYDAKGLRSTTFQSDAYCATNALYYYYSSEWVGGWVGGRARRGAWLRDVRCGARGCVCDGTAPHAASPPRSLLLPRPMPLVGLPAGRTPKTDAWKCHQVKAANVAALVLGCYQKCLARADCTAFIFKQYGYTSKPSITCPAGVPKDAGSERGGDGGVHTGTQPCHACASQHAEAPCLPQLLTSTA